MQNRFDDFLNIDGELGKTFVALALRYVKIFLRKIGARKVDEINVKFVKQPFLDIMYGFKINGQIVLLDQSFIRQQKLKDQYDSTLAHIFDSFDYKRIDELCKNIKEEIKKIYLRR